MATRRRTKSSNTTIKFGIAVVILIGGALVTYGVVRAAGWLNPATAPLAQKPSREGRVPVPKSLIALRAFEKVEREDVFNLALGDDSYFWLPQQQVDAHPEWITDLNQIVGRVMARDKRSDFVFSEKDFLPEGSRTGIAGGIPTGKQGFFLEAEQIPGLRFLKNGDRFDLLASLPEESENATAEYGLLMGGIKARGGKPIPINGVRTLVQGGEMIALTTNRSMTTQGGLELSTTDSRGREISTRKDERVVIAIDPAEAVPLTQALGAKRTIHMVTRSGQNVAEIDGADALKNMIAFPATAGAIKAFATVTATSLSEPISGELRQYYFQPGDVQDGWIPRVEDLVGKVVARDIEPGYIFSADDFLPSGSLIKDVQAYEALAATDLVGGEHSPWIGRVANGDLNAGHAVQESDLLPPGTPSGVAAGIPTGRMGMMLSNDEVHGLADFMRGDRFDLIASEEFDLRRTLGGVQLSPSVAAGIAQAVNQIVATEALIIDVSDESTIVALLPSEIALVTKALAAGTPLFTIARPSSNIITTEQPEPNRITERLVSDPNPLENVAITQMLIDGKRSVRAYRKSNASNDPRSNGSQGPLRQPRAGESL